MSVRVGSERANLNSELLLCLKIRRLPKYLSALRILFNAINYCEDLKQATTLNRFVGGGLGGWGVEYSTPPGKSSDIKEKKLESHSEVADFRL